MEMTYTNRQIYETVKKRLEDAGIEDAYVDAKHIFYHASGKDATWMLTHYAEEAEESTVEQMLKDCEERLSGRPLQYIIGHWGFYTIDIITREGVLIPRQDTETLVGTGVEFLKTFGDTDVLDLCTGSGCIALAVKDNAKGCNVTALDYFEEPLRLAKENCEHTGLEVNLVRGDVLAGTGADGEYGLILCNPPYVETEVVDTLQDEVKCEPREAFDGGDDGLDFYRALKDHWVEKLKTGGMLAVEIGCNMGDAVTEIFKSAGLKNVKITLDGSGLHRVVSGIK